jgi:hypothetical protein
VRDVEAAYRLIPLRASGWAGVVVRIDDDSFAIDTCTMFGEAASGGQYGTLADAGTDIMRANGISPISHWVVDHGFFWIRRAQLEVYNAQHAAACARIASNLFRSRFDTAEESGGPGEILPKAGPRTLWRTCSLQSMISGLPPRTGSSTASMTLTPSPARLGFDGALTKTSLSRHGTLQWACCVTRRPQP